MNSWWELLENMDGTVSFMNAFGHRLHEGGTSSLSVFCIIPLLLVNAVASAGHTEFFVHHHGGDIVSLRAWSGCYLTDHPTWNGGEWPMMIGDFEMFHLVHMNQVA